MVFGRAGHYRARVGQPLNLNGVFYSARRRARSYLVTLLIGVNNQYRGLAIENYRVEFVALIKRAIAYARNRADHVIVISIPDWGVTPQGRNRNGVSAEIDAFNAVNREETQRLGAQYIDITPSSRDGLHDPALLAADGLHLSGKMYARWSDSCCL